MLAPGSGSRGLRAAAQHHYPARCCTQTDVKESGAHRCGTAACCCLRARCRVPAGAAGCSGHGALEVVSNSGEEARGHVQRLLSAELAFSTPPFIHKNEVEDSTVVFLECRENPPVLARHQLLGNENFSVGSRLQQRADPCSPPESAAVAPFCVRFPGQGGSPFLSDAWSHTEQQSLKNWCFLLFPPVFQAFKVLQALACAARAGRSAGCSVRAAQLCFAVPGGSRGREHCAAPGMLTLHVMHKEMPRWPGIGAVPGAAGARCC